MQVSLEGFPARDAMNRNFCSTAVQPASFFTKVLEQVYLYMLHSQLSILRPLLQTAVASTTVQAAIQHNESWRPSPPQNRLLTAGLYSAGA